MEEACQILLTAWTQDNWTFAGRHHEYRNVSVYPKSVQRPHPRLWISGRNDVAAARAARFKTPLLVAPQPYAIDPEAIYGAYAAGLRAAGEDPLHYEVAGSYNCIVTDDPKAYRAKVRAGSRQRAQTYEKWYSDAADISDDADRILNPKQTGWSPTVIGDPETCIESLTGYLDHTSVPYTNLIMAVYDAKAIEAFARDVMPHFQ